MPLYPSYSLRYAFRASGFVAAFAIFSLFSPIAHADPHAVFYTDRGQEQVFFNVLAALNQADFVEPGTTGTGRVRTREELVQERAAAAAKNPPSDNPPAGQDIKFTAEQNPLITSTHTDLPGVVSRSITLEGNDLWTSYLVHQYALETATRRSESRLARVLCQNALGDPGCNSRAGNDKEQDKAFETIPVNSDGDIAIARDAILASGSVGEIALHKTIQEKTNAKEIGKNPALYSVPRPYSPELGLLRTSIAGNQEANSFLNNLTTNVSGLSLAPDPTTFSDVSFDADGTPKIAGNDDITGEGYAYKLRQLINLPYQLEAVAEAGEREAERFKFYQENPIAKADSILESNDANGTGPLIGRITKPSSAKLASVYSAFDLINLIASSQKYANPAVIVTPGKTSVIDAGTSITQPGQTDGLPDFGNTVLNTLDSSLNQNGQVAGLSSTFDIEQNRTFRETYEDSNRFQLSPSVNSRDPIEEPGPLQLLDQLTNESSNAFGFSTEVTRSAFDMSMNSLLATTEIGDILCSIYPSIEACLDQQQPTV